MEPWRNSIQGGWPVSIWYKVHIKLQMSVLKLCSSLLQTCSNNTPIILHWQKKSNHCQYDNFISTKETLLKKTLIVPWVESIRRSLQPSLLCSSFTQCFSNPACLYSHLRRAGLPKCCNGRHKTREQAQVVKKNLEGM